ncbi:MAG TPA: polymorphic toxin-type HINT domain-containing protein [Verrucomicrobiae bacterium]|nr:polymorphic toxin-type HINT domain-containing protein [Verrucomicrobiae bacterium]
MSSGTINFTSASAFNVNALSVNGAIVNFNDSAGQTIGLLNFSGGTIQGSSPIQVTNFTWTAGSLQDVLQFSNGTVGTGGSKFLYSWLINNGTMGWNDTINSQSGATVISNALGATITLGSGVGMLNTGGLVANNGTLTMSGPGSSGIAQVFNNAGTVSVNGTLNLSGSGTETGIFSVSGGSTFNLSGGTWGFQTGSTISGAGTASLNSGTINFTGTSTVNVSGLNVAGATVNFSDSGTMVLPALNFSSGTVEGSSLVQVSGTFSWESGQLEDAIQVSNGTVGAGGQKLLYGSLIGAGTMAWNDGIFMQAASSMLSNAVGSTLTLTSGAGTFNASGVVANNGTMTMSGSGTSTIGPPFNNAGAVNVSGTLNLNGGGTETGNFSVPSGASLNVSGGTCGFQSASGVSGAGNFTLSGGTANLAGAFGLTGNYTFSGGTANFSGSGYAVGGTVSISGSTINLNGSGIFAPAGLTESGGQLAGSSPPNPIIVSGSFAWTGGYIYDPVQFGNGTVGAGNQKLLYGSLINTGTMAWNDNIFMQAASSTISNAVGATLTLAPGIGTFNGGGAVANNGTFTMSGTSASSILSAFNNGGMVNVGGTLNLSGGGTETGGFSIPSGSTMNLSGGTWGFQSASSISGAGNLTLSGGTENLAGTVGVSGGYTFSGGIANFTGSGYAIGGTVLISGATVNLNGTGTFSPASLTESGGTLAGSSPPNPITVSSSFTWTAGYIYDAVQFGNGTVGANNQKLLYGSLINTGTMAWNDNIFMQSGSTLISNAVGSTITLASGVGTFNGGGRVANNGTFTMTGPNTSVIGTFFNNAGTVNVGGGEINFQGAYTNTSSAIVSLGISNVASYGHLAFNQPLIMAGLLTASVNGGGSYQPLAGDTFTLMTYPSRTGAFNYSFPAGTQWQATNGTTSLTLVSFGSLATTNTYTWTGAASSDWFNPTNWSPNGVPGLHDIVNVGGGTIVLTSPVTIGNQLNWFGGNFAGSSLTIASNGVLNLNGSSTIYLQNVLTNEGTVNYSSTGAFYVQNNNGGLLGTIDNMPGAVWDFLGDPDSINCYYCSGSEVFNNAGTVEKTGGTGASSINLPFNNSGLVAAQTGTIAFSHGGSMNGSYTASSGAVINFSGGAFSYTTTPVLTGPGLIEITGGSLTLANDVIPGLQMTGGTLSLGAGFQGGSITNLSVGAVTLSGNHAVSGSLTCNGTTVPGSWMVLGGGTMNWSGGAISGPLTVGSNGVLNVTGSGTIYLQNVLTNEGTVNYSGTGTFYVQNNGSGVLGAIDNMPGAVWDFLNDPGGINCYYCGGSEVFNNAGTVEKTGGTGTSNVHLTFNNTGLVVAQTGTIAFSEGGIMNGSYSASSGAVINFSGGPFSYTTIPVLTGPGLIEITGGSLTLANNIIPGLQMNGGTISLGAGFQGGSITNLTFTGATLSGNWTVIGTFNCGNGVSGNLAIAPGALLNWSGGTISGSLTEAAGATVNWSGGIMGGPLTVNSSAVLNVSGNSTIYLQNILTNQGTVNYSATGTFYVQNNGSGLIGTIDNMPGALWDFVNDPGGINCYYCGGSEVFNNAGTVEKSVGTGTSNVHIPFNNSGLVAALTGTITFQYGGIMNGSYSASSGAVINFNGGAFSYTTTPTLTGPGLIEMTAGSLTLVNDIIPGLRMNGGTLSLGAGFQGGSVSNLSVGAVTVSGNHTVSGTLTCSGTTVPGSWMVLGGGTLNWSGGVISGPLTVGSNGVLNVGGVSTIYLQNILTNEGTVNYSSTSAFYVQNNNGGLLGTIDNMPGAVWDFLNDPGSINCYYCGGSEVFNNAGTVEKSGGTGISSINMLFYNTGTLNGLTGTIYFSGANDYTEADATYDLTSPGPGHAALVQVNGKLALDGTLNVNLANTYTPKKGDSIPLIVSGTLTNSFNDLNLPTAGNNLGWQVTYGLTTVSISVISNANVTAQITGLVTNNTGAPVTNVTVFAFATNSNTSVFLSTVTDVNGNYALGVTNGIWNVGVEGLVPRGYNNVPNQIATVNNVNQIINFSVSPYTGPNYLITVTANPASGGSATGGGVFLPGSSVTLTATANTSTLPYYFVNWTENGIVQSANNPYVFPASRNEQIVANFTLPLFAITASNNPAGGGSIFGTGNYFYGSTATLTAVPSFGYNFTDWTEGTNFITSNTSFSVTIYTNHNYTANYSQGNPYHWVSTASQPAALAAIAGAGVYTNGQIATFTAPSPVTVAPNVYTFQYFMVSNVIVNFNSTYNKTFSFLDQTNLQYVAVYGSKPILPQLIGVSANFANPVPATTNFLLTLQFDRSMKTNPPPTIVLTNSGTVLQATVGTNGYWTTNAQANDTYHAPPVSFIIGMDGTNQLYVSGALDLSSDMLALTNPTNFLVNATPPAAPVLSLVSSNSSSVVVSWAGYVAPSDLSEFRVYLEPTNFTYAAGMPVVTALGAGSPSVQVGGLALNTTYYLGVAAIDVAGNVSAINTFQITLPSTVPPPVTVQESPVGASSALLSWTGYNTSGFLGFAGFHVYYQTTPFSSVTSLTPQATLAPGTISYQVNGLDRTKTYYFAVVGYNTFNGFNPAVSTVSWSDPYAGTISSNTTIGSNVQSVVTIYQNIVVTNNAVLTIKPGTTLLFEPGTSLKVQQGSLQANGSVFSPIIFDSANDSPGNTPVPGDWGGVILGNGAGSSFLNFVTVQYGNGLVVSGCTPSVQALTAQYDTQGITGQGGGSLNTSNALVAFDGIGVVQSDTATLTIQNSVIQNNGTNGIQTGSTQMSATSDWWGSASQSAVTASLQGNILFGPFLSYEPVLTPAAATVGGVVQTGSPLVNLQLACRTANSMRISENEFFTGVFFGPYTNFDAFALSPEGGLKRIFVQFSSVTGTTNNPIEVDVNYITGGPVVQSFSLTNGETLSRPLTVTGSATAVLGMQDIELYVDGIGVATNAGGSFSYYFDVRSLPNGPHQAELLARDTTGKASSLQSSVIVSLTPPPAPVITSPPANLLTNMDFVTVTGTAEPNINIQITDNGQVLALTNSGATGNFTVTNAELTEGVNSLVAIASDNIGIRPSAAVQVTVETIPPAVSVMNPITYHPGQGLAISWQPPVTGKQPTTYELFWSTSPFTSTTQATGHTIILSTVYDNIQGLANGTYYFGVVGYDTAGNPSALSQLVSILYNTTPPALSLAYSPPSTPTGPGPLTIVLTSSAALASTPSLTIQPAGTASPILLSLTNVAVNTWQSAFTITPATHSGTANFQASAQDQQGNLFQGAPSGPPLVIDTIPPVGTIVTQPAGPVQTINPTNVIVNLTLSESVSNGTTPSLSFQPPLGASVMVNLSGSGSNWNGTLPLTSAMGKGYGQFSLSAIDGLGNVGTSIIAGGLLEIYNTSLPLPPAAPLNLTTKSLPGGYVSLSWSPVSTAQIYRLYREAGTTFTLPAPLDIDNITTNTVVDLPPADGIYGYGITASRYGSESTLASAAGGISDRTPAPAPTNVVATLLSSGVQISWQEPDGDEYPTTFKIYRNGTAISTVSSSIFSATDFPPRGTNTYIVSSVDGAGNENPSLPVTVKLLVTPVFNFSALVVAGQSPQLTWSSSDSTVVGFNVYRNGILQNSSPLTSSNYTDSLPLSDATTYSVTAVNGSSQESPQRTVTVYPVNLSLVADSGNPVTINYFDNVNVGVANLAGSQTLPLSEFILNRQIPAINPLTVTQAVNATVAPGSNFLQSIVLPESPIIATQSMTLSAVEQTDAADDTAIYRQTFMLTNSQQPGTEINVSANQLPLAGGLNSFQVQIFNQGFADMQMIVSRNDGTQPGDLYISVQNSFGQEVSRTPFTGTPPGTIFLLDGNGYVDIPAGSSMTFNVTNVLVPAALAGSTNVSFVAVVPQIYNQLETPNQTVSGPLSGSMFSSSLALPSYYGTASTDHPGYANTQPIIISGQAISQSTGLPMANTALNIGFSTRGYRWYQSVTTDTNGNYQYSYNPPLGFEGSLTIWAANPLVVDQLNQAQVTFYSMYANPGGGDFTMSKNGTLDFSIQLINPGDTPLTDVNLNFSAFQVSGTNEISISTMTGTNLSGDGFTLGANETKTINLRLAAAANAPDNAGVQFTFTSAEGASTTFGGSVALLPAVPILTVPNPSAGYLEVSVNQGDLKSGTITILNDGLEDLKGVTLTPPTNSWIAVDLPVSPDGLIHLPDLGIGQSNTFAVVFTPTTNNPLAIYSDSVVIQGTNSSTPFKVGVYAIVTSSLTGNVQFSVIDILNQVVPEAQINLQNTLTQTSVGPFYTDDNGMLTVTNLEEGSWNWQISAQGCASLAGNVNVIANQTVQVSRALSRSLVTINFNVVPVPFTDEYTIQVEQTFQTHVPVPNLIMTPSYVSFDNVTPGFQASFNVTLENEGLVEVDQVAITGQQDDLATLTPLISYIPSLQPFQTVEIPYTLTWVGPGTAPSQQDKAGDLINNGLKYANCAPLDFAGAINGFIEGLSDFMLYMANGLGFCQATGLPIPTVDNGSAVAVTPAQVESAGNWLCALAGGLPDGGQINIKGSIGLGGINIEPQCPDNIKDAFKAGELIGCLMTKSVKAQLQNNPLPPPEQIVPAIGPGGPSCLGPDTLVLLADGSREKISDVQSGDIVRCGANSNELARVDRIYSAPSNSVRSISFQCPATGDVEKLITTDDHLFWVDGTGWMEAGNLQVGDRLLRSTGGNAIITANQPLPEKSEVYTLWLRKNHAFFANDVLVHDLCGAMIPLQTAKVRKVGVAR